MKTIIPIACATLFASLGVAQAQGLVGGAERGADRGAEAAGPVGAVVGGAVGAAAGTAGGLLGVEERPRFRHYVDDEHHRSYRYEGGLRPGVVLPEEGISYYDVPPEYRVRSGYRYTIINDRPVLVEPTTRRVIEVIE